MLVRKSPVDAAMNMGAFEALNDDELMLVDGGKYDHWMLDVGSAMMDVAPGLPAPLNLVFYIIGSVFSIYG